jgi:hypothetical protein
MPLGEVGLCYNQRTSKTASTKLSDTPAGHTTPHLVLSWTVRLTVPSFARS